MGVEFRHRLRLVRHPEVVDIFHTATAPQPRLTEPFERMPAHTFLVQSHLGEARRKPVIFQIAIKVRRAVRRKEQQAAFPSNIELQELCNTGVQVNLSLRSGSLEVFHDTLTVLLDLLLDSDGATAIDEMLSLYREGLRNSHACGCDQDV